MSNFTVEISVKNDGKIISLDADEMEIYIYQETGNGTVRVFEIACDAPGGKVIGTLRTKVEFVGDEDESGPVELKALDANFGANTLEAYSNKYGE
jgi:hypothetical protein